MSSRAATSPCSSIKPDDIRSMYLFSRAPVRYPRRRSSGASIFVILTQASSEFGPCPISTHTNSIPLSSAGGQRNNSLLDRESVDFRGADEVVVGQAVDC